MKRMTNGLRIWIAGSTLVGFLTGWSLLAHSGTTVVDTSAVAPVSQVAAIAQTTTQVVWPTASATSVSTGTNASANASTSTSNNQSQSLQQITVSSAATSNMPRLRTSGS